MTAALQAQGLGKKYGKRWALSDCTLDVPAGRVVGLVGPNGAGAPPLSGGRGIAPIGYAVTG